MSGFAKDRKRGNADIRITSHFLALTPLVVSKCAVKIYFYLLLQFYSIYYIDYNKVQYV